MQRAEIAPLHSSLDDRARLHLKLLTDSFNPLPRSRLLRPRLDPAAPAVLGGLRRDLDLAADELNDDGYNALCVEDVLHEEVRTREYSKGGSVFLIVILRKGRL